MNIHSWTDAVLYFSFFILVAVICAIGLILRSISWIRLVQLASRLKNNPLTIGIWVSHSGIEKSLCETLGKYGFTVKCLSFFFKTKNQIRADQDTDIIVELDIDRPGCSLLTLADVKTTTFKEVSLKLDRGIINQEKSDRIVEAVIPRIIDFLRWTMRDRVKQGTTKTQSASA
jgi:hypothetical protein